MTMSLTEDRFRALGMKVPDLGFMRKEESPSVRWGRENPYNTRVLLDNWYEDRRAYENICGRCTGHSITRTDYLDYCKENYMKDGVIPPNGYAQRLRDEGEGPNLLRNTEDYCDYLQNYTTTYDLMYNWEVRRAGCKPKPWRKWKLIQDAHWAPERDNTVSFGNLTQFGYRKAPQLPILPNDWDVYANNQTSYEHSFGPPRYPDHYVHCRRAVSKELRRENEEMVIVTNPCYKCKSDHKDKDKQEDSDCGCICHAIDAALDNDKNIKKSKRTRPVASGNPPRFGDQGKSAGQLKETPGLQNLHATDAPFPYRTLKHPYHSPVGQCKPDCPIPLTEHKETKVFAKPDICSDFAGDVRRE